MDEDDKNATTVLALSEKAVVYLCNYERLHIFKRTKRRVRRIAAR